MEAEAYIIVNYLSIVSRMYGNAVQDDLWTALTYQAELDSVKLPTDIKTIMDSWTLKMGYPVVNVIRNYTYSLITVQQVLI